MLIRKMMAVCVCLLLACDMSYAASGVQGGKANGMAAAFVAVADDASAIAFNPAGITQIKGAQLYGGVSGVVPSNTYTSVAGVSQKMEKQIFAAPNLYFTSDTPVKNLFYGIGIYSPFGIGGAKWSTTGLTRYVSTENLTATMVVNPVIAYKIGDSLSIAAGFNYMYAQLQSRNSTNQSFLRAPDGAVEMKGDGDGIGYNVGLMYQISKRIKVGLAYRSEIKINIRGDFHLSNIAPPIQPFFGGSTYLSGFKTSTVFPSVFNLGVAYTADGGSVFTIEVQRDGWSSLGQNVLILNRPVPAAGLGNTITSLDWKNTWQFKAGMDYKLSQQSSFRLGYVYTASPAPDHTFSPATPFLKSHLIGVGYGYQMGNYFVDLFYFGGILTKRSVNNAILSGSYKGQIHHAGLSVGYNFN